MRRGKEGKFLISVQPIGGYHMSDYDFEIDLYVHPNRAVTVKKSDPGVIKENDDSYKICITSEMSAKLGKGKVLADLYAAIPDADFEDGYRTEVSKELCTTVTL